MNVVATEEDSTGRPTRSSMGCTEASEGICTQAEAMTASALAVFRRRVISMGARASWAPTCRLSAISSEMLSTTSMPSFSM